MDNKGNNLKKYVTIKDLPENERPRERLIKYGPQMLSNAELIAIILRTGYKEENALSLATRLLGEAPSGNGLEFLLDSSVEELAKIKGIGLAKAVELKAAVELGRRVGIISKKVQYVKSPQDVGDLLMEEMRYLKKEHFNIIMLNTKNQVIGIENISIGTLNTSLVHPREVFHAAIKRSSASIVLVHNHPSGDPTPSREDIAITQRMIEAGKILGIEVLDHVIIGNGKFLSLKQENMI